MSCEALKVRTVYRNLVKSVKKHIGNEDTKKHTREYVTEEFRKKSSDLSFSTRRIKLAHDYTFLLISVHHHQNLLLSYNIYVDRTNEMKRVLKKSAASVGLRLPEPYRP